MTGTVDGPTGIGSGITPPGRLTELSPYPLADVPDINAKLRAEGHAVFDLGVGSAGLIGALRRVKTFFDSGSFLAIQAAGAALLRDPDPWIRDTVDCLRERRDAAVGEFRSAGFELESPKATLYLELRVPGQETSEAYADACRQASRVL